MRRFIILAAIMVILATAGMASVTAQAVHTVQQGENLYRIAREYGVTVDSIVQANSLTSYSIHPGNQLVIPGAGGAAAPAASAPAPTIGAYTVRPGDSLASIAAAHNTNYLTLAEMNNLINPDVLFVGQTLIVPGAPAPSAAPAAPAASAPATSTGAYTVRPGDSLASIAAAHNTNYLTLAEMNNIINPDVLIVGQVLRVPAPPPPAAPAAPAASAPAPAPAPSNTASTGGFELGGQALSFSHPSHMKNARMTWVKRQVKWHGTESAGDFQHVINSAKGNGFKVLLSVIGEPSQIAGNPGQYYQNYANFLAGLAAGGADGIEVWNEMNIDREWPSGLISGANYTQMLSAAFRAIKAANPSTLVVSGAPAPTGFFQGCSTRGGDDDCFIRQMAAAGAAQFMDCVGIHYNAGIVPPNASSGAQVGSSGHYSWYYPRMVSLYRSVFPSKPLCFTELGYLTGEGIGPLPGGFAWASGNTLGEQAAWLAEVTTRARSSGNVRLLIVWNVDATQYGADPQAGYAIVRPGNSCPACNSLRLAMGG